MVEASGCLLSQKSKVFETELSKHYEIILDEFMDNVDGFYDCLELIYGGIVNVTIINLLSLIKFSIRFQIPDMYNLCSDWVNNHVTAKNVHEIYKIGLSHARIIF